MQPEVYANMKQLAAFDKRTLSAMCASLIETAMELPRYQTMLEEARVSMGEVHVKPDPRKARKQEHRPSVTEEEETYSEEEKMTERGFISDGKGGYVAADLTEDDEMAWDLHKAQLVRPGITPDQQARLFSMIATGQLSREQALEMMTLQAPAEGQTKEEKRAEMQADLLKTTGIQKEKAQKMDEMLPELKELMEGLAKLKS
jgi:hypothetical protein